MLLHLTFWCGVLFYFAYIISVDNTINTNVFYFSLFLMPITIGTTYVSIYNLIPNYLVTKKYHLFVLYGTYTVIISIFSIFLSIFFGIAFLSNFEFGELNSINRSGVFIITCVYLVVIIVSAFKLLKLNLKQSKTNAALEAKFLKTELKLKNQELKYLKMQIHPHFLFNTLNTIYGFALQKADQTPEMVLKLSNLLDYLLYKSEQPLVSIEDEINHIEDYVQLEELRFNETLKVKITKSIVTNTVEIAPMLFLPFVENSFKHGAIIDEFLSIDIKINAQTNIIKFSISNTSKNTTSHQLGIGLNNIKKRLELIYPEQYKLSITQANNLYKVDLTLHVNTSKNNE